MERKHWIRIVAFCLVAFLLYRGAAWFLQVPSARNNVRVFAMEQEPENTLDVVLIGSSNVYTSWYAPLAYEQQGFTSYALATDSMPGVVIRSAIREVERLQDPQAIVIDLWCFAYTEEEMLDEAHLRRWIDSIPNTENRALTIKEAVPEEEQAFYEDSFLKYHGNWIALKRCVEAAKEKFAIWRRGYSLTKGYCTKTNIYTGDAKITEFPISDRGMEELKLVLELCKEEGLENVIFARFPEYVHLKSTESLEQAKALIAEYGYTYLDPWEDPEAVGLDYSHDFYNDGHVNVFGTEKFTRYMGDYLTAHCNIDTTHSAAVTEEWDKCAAVTDQVLSYCKKETENKTKKTLDYDREYLH